MAYLNAICQDNYLSVNITLAKLFGLNTAVYWTELIRIISKVNNKKKFDEQGFFIVDRDYIEKRTTLTEADQHICDEILVSAGVMAVDRENVNRLSVDVKSVLEFIIEGDITSVAKKAKTITRKVSAEEKRVAKKAGMKAGMQKYIAETDPDLKKAYFDWIDVLVENKMLNRVTVERFEKNINSFAVDKSVKLEIIEIAATRLYQDAEWAITQFNKLHGNVKQGSTPIALGAQKVVTNTAGVAADIEI